MSKTSGQVRVREVRQVLDHLLEAFNIGDPRQIVTDLSFPYVEIVDRREGARIYTFGYDAFTIRVEEMVGAGGKRISKSLATTFLGHSAVIARQKLALQQDKQKPQPYLAVHFLAKPRDRWLLCSTWYSSFPVG